MRRKIAKRRRKELLAKGVFIVSEYWIREPGWKRKDIGYGIRFKYKEHEVSLCEFDELEAYHALAECLEMLDDWNGEGIVVGYVRGG